MYKRVEDAWTPNVDRTQPTTDCNTTVYLHTKVNINQVSASVARYKNKYSR